MNRLVHPLNRWNSRRPSYTWLGDVRFPLLTSTCPNIILNTTPSTKMISHGSIIHQKKPASSVGTLMLITVPGMMMYLQTLELCTSRMDGSAVKGSAKRRFSNARLYQKTHSYSKADWLLFCNCFDNGIHAMSSVVPLPNVWRPYVSS